MRREPRVRQPRPLVIPRDDEHRNATLRDATERLERLIRDAWRNPRPVEDIAGVHNEIDLSSQRGLERRPVVRQEVVPPTAPAHPRRDR
jgi:hypothetical protein